MLKTDIHRIVHVICRRARRCGFVQAGDVQEALARAGLPETLWTTVVSLAGDMLRNRDGCFYYCAAAAARRREQRQRRRLNRVVRQLIRGYRTSVQHERRQQGRFDFVQPVLVETEDGQTMTLLSCDLSTRGIRLVGSTSLLGKKLRVTVPGGPGTKSCCFAVRIVWSSRIGEALYEHGGAFVEVSHRCDQRPGPAMAADPRPFTPAQLTQLTRLPGDHAELPIVIGDVAPTRVR